MQTVNLSKEELLEGMRNSLDVLFAFFLPQIYTAPLSPAHHAIFRMVKENLENGRDAFYAIGLPRGFAKTTIAKLLVLYVFLFSTKRYALIACANAEKAQIFNADIVNLLRGANARRMFGNWESYASTDTKELKVFKFGGKTCILQAVGAGGDPRGANVDFARPDFILCDDIQSRTNARSPAESAALHDWFTATLTFTKSPQGCTLIYIGNMYPYDGCILKKLVRNPSYTTFVVGAILADGQSLWPEVFPIEKLQEDFILTQRSGSPEIFLSELLNYDKSVASTTVNFDELPRYTYSDLSIPEAGFVIVDPAGDNANSDSTAMALVLIFAGIPHVRKIVKAKLNPEMILRTAANLAEEFGLRTIIIESYAFQKSLIFWAKKIPELAPFRFLPISRGVKSKNSAILSIIDDIRQGSLVLHPEVESTLLSELIYFDPQSKANKDDALDVTAYIPLAMARYGHEISVTSAKELLVDPVRPRHFRETSPI